MDHDPVRGGALPAAFESACLVRCTGSTRLPGRRRPERAVPAAAALAEFDRKDAAERLASLLAGLGYDASREVRTGGGRRRYELQRVLVPEPQRTATDRLIAAAWQQGRQALLGTDPLGSSSPRHARRLMLAHAAWRAVLHAGGRRFRADLLCVRLADQEMAAVLVRAARLLDLTAEVSSRPGCLLVTVPAVTASFLLAGTMSVAGGRSTPLEAACPVGA